MAAVLFVGSGCQSSAYRPQHSWSRVGYSSHAWGSDRWMVTYSGPMKSDPGVVKDFTLLRCAEVTARAGRRYFVVLDDYSRPQSAGSVRDASGDAVPGLMLNDTLADRPVVLPNPILTMRIVTADAVPANFRPQSTYEARPLIAQLRAKYGLKVPKN